MHIAPPPARWFTTPRPVPRARLRLVCLPHAGAGASVFFPWGEALAPAGIEVWAVRYPGREERLAEPALDSAAAMTAALVRAWAALPEGTCAIYGHSMGALLAYELALGLARANAPSRPARLFLSGCNPPSAPPRREPLHRLPEGAFLAAVAARYGNLPPAVLADPEMVELIAPVLRADLRLVETYSRTDGASADEPLTVLGGREDPFVREEDLAGWRRHTGAACRLRMLPGGHFFPQASRDAVLAEIISDARFL